MERTRQLDSHADRPFCHEEMNRTRQQIQNRWNEAQRTLRRQVAESRQRALAQLLSLAPLDRSRPRQSA